MSCQVLWVCYITGGIFLEINKAKQVENPCTKKPVFFFPPPNVCSIIFQCQCSPLCGEALLMGSFSACFGKASPLTSSLSLPPPREPHDQSLLSLAPIQAGTYAGHCSNSEAGGSLPGCPRDKEAFLLHLLEKLGKRAGIRARARAGSSVCLWVSYQRCWGSSSLLYMSLLSSGAGTTGWQNDWGETWHLLGSLCWKGAHAAAGSWAAPTLGGAPPSRNCWLPPRKVPPCKGFASYLQHFPSAGETRAHPCCECL